MAPSVPIDFPALIQQLIATPEFGTQDALARAIGISPSRLSRVLKGHGSLEVENCLKLAKVTGLPPDEIFRAAGKSDIAGLIRDLYGPGKRLVVSPSEAFVSALSDESQVKLKALLDQLAKDAARPTKRSGRKP